MLNKKAFVPIALLISVVVLSGCSFVNIQNMSDAEITVSVKVPDSGSSSTRNIQAGDIVDVFSANGGRYSISLLPGQRYQELLENLRQLISQRLFEDGATLSADEVARLIEKLNQVDQLIEDLADPMPFCSGYLPDFETVVVVVAYDESSGNYVLSCGTGSE